MSGEFSMGGNEIANLADPSNDQDAVSKTLCNQSRDFEVRCNDRNNT